MGLWNYNMLMHFDDPCLKYVLCLNSPALGSQTVALDVLFSVAGKKKHMFDGRSIAMVMVNHFSLANQVSRK